MKMINKFHLIEMRLNQMHPNFEDVEEAIDFELIHATENGRKDVNVRLDKIIEGYLPEGMSVDVELMETLIVSRYKDAGYKIIKTSDSHLNTVYCFELI